jgi:hypothetical protein
MISHDPNVGLIGTQGLARLKEARIEELVQIHHHLLQLHRRIKPRPARLSISVPKVP